MKVKKTAEYISNISWEDSWQKAYALAKEAAEAELKNILAKIDNDNISLIEIVGPQGPRGFKGQTGKSYPMPTIDATSEQLYLSDTAYNVLQNMIKKVPPSNFLSLSLNLTKENSIGLSTLFSNSIVTSTDGNTTHVNPSDDVQNTFDLMLSNNENVYLQMVQNGSLIIRGISPMFTSNVLEIIITLPVISLNIKLLVRQKLSSN